MYLIAMGPLHGKLMRHLPSEFIGIARSRVLSGSGKDRIWEYSLLLATGKRTPFFPEDEFQKPSRDQVMAFVAKQSQTKAERARSAAKVRRRPGRL